MVIGGIEGAMVVGDERRPFFWSRTEAGSEPAKFSQLR
jgi:hypothetical protein